MEGKAILIELHYLPCIAYFNEILKYDLVVIDDLERFQKQTYRNRCKVLGPNGTHDLSVPVSGKRKNIKDVNIDYSQGWKNQHIRALESYYGKAPYFEYYFDYFFKIYSQEKSLLYELNFALMTLCLKILGNPVEMTELSKFNENKRLPLIEQKELINRKKDLTKTHFPQYNQLFGKQFEPNLSVIDLLFCEGPAATAHLDF